MRRSAFILALFTAACGSGAAHPYPERARAEFFNSCPAEEPQCTCTWEALTHRIPYEDYSAAMDRFSADGLMDPRITRARTECLERHAG